ncbi:Extended synaptotagmin-2 [Bulinus truncatus]|nr:Extended synaptotagmin-2 [Bulinus truncatus]
MCMFENDNVLQKVLEQNKDVDDSHVGFLLVFLDSARNLPRGKKSLQEPSPQATLSVGQQKYDSSTKYNTNEPKWEENYRFLLRNPHYQNLEIELKDSKTKKAIGGKVIKLKELLAAEDMILDQKFHIKTSESDSYLQMRLCLRILTPTANPQWTEEQDDDDLMNTKQTEEIKQNGTSVDDPSPDKVPGKVNGTAAKPAESEETESSIVEGDVVPVITKVLESEMRQRKSVSGNGTGTHGLGRIQMTFRYSHQRQRLILVVHKCSNLKPAQGDAKNLADPYVKIYLLPDKSSASKKRTKVIKDNLNPVFDETFEYSVSLQEVSKRTLEITVKNEVGMFSSSETMIGKVLLDLSSLDFSKAITEWFDLAPENEAKPKTFQSDV